MIVQQFAWFDIDSCPNEVGSHKHGSTRRFSYDMDLGVAPDIARGAATRFKMPISFKQVNTG